MHKQDTSKTTNKGNRPRTLQPCRFLGAGMGDFTRSVGCWRLLACGAAFFALVQVAEVRGEVQFAVPEESNTAIAITLNDAKLDEFLTGLTERFGIDVQIRSALSAGSLNGAFNGRLSELLPRILRGHDYLLVRGRQGVPGSDGIERIVLLRSATGNNAGLISRTSQAQRSGDEVRGLNARAPAQPATASGGAGTASQEIPSPPSRGLQHAFETGLPPENVGFPNRTNPYTSEEEQAQALVQQAQEQVNRIADRMQQVCVASGRCDEVPAK